VLGVSLSTAAGAVRGGGGTGNTGSENDGGGRHEGEGHAGGAEGDLHDVSFRRVSAVALTPDKRDHRRLSRENFGKFL
jgi:hypothetical protein